MDYDLHTLIEAARSARMTREDIERQRESFAYGNTRIDNRRVTKEVIAKAVRTLKENDEY